jgi:hypothetical protein
VVANYRKSLYEQYSKSGQETRSDWFDDAGADGLWFSADDSPSFVQVYDYDAQGNQIDDVYRGVGDDGTFNTGDDVWQFYTREYDSAGNEIRWISYGNADDGSNVGPDGIPLTEDDEIEAYQLSYYDASNRLVRVESYTQMGADNLWLTTDDPVHQYELISYDAAGNKTTSCSYVNWEAGDDGIFGNEDDPEVSCWYSTYDANNNQIAYYGYSADNAIGVLDGVHDRGAQYFTHEYNSAGKQTLLVEWDMGPDERHGTSDDIMMMKIVTTYDQQGRDVKRQDRRYGADLTFGTDDDVMTYDITEY